MNQSRLFIPFQFALLFASGIRPEMQGEGACSAFFHAANCGEIEERASGSLKYFKSGEISNNNAAAQFFFLLPCSFSTLHALLSLA